jgi:hypothetical protein
VIGNAQCASELFVGCVSTTLCGNFELQITVTDIAQHTPYQGFSQPRSQARSRRSLLLRKDPGWGWALDHIELTYHDVIISKIPEVQVTGFKIFNYYRNGDAQE